MIHSTVINECAFQTDRDAAGSLDIEDRSAGLSKRVGLADSDFDSEHSDADAACSAEVSSHAASRRQGACIETSHYGPKNFPRGEFMTVLPRTCLRILFM